MSGPSGGSAERAGKETGRGARTKPGSQPATRPGKKTVGAPSRGSLRVVAGEARGRRLDAPPGDTTRPTSDRVRQALFNSLESMGAVDGARVLDAFAGSGALGIEALSRGAEHVVFAETSAAARSVIEANLTSTGLADRSTVVGRDGAIEATRGGRWDLVLLDPPYGFDGWEDLLVSVAGSLRPEAVVVIESDREIVPPSSFGVIRSKRYGGTVVTFAIPSGATS